MRAMIGYSNYDDFHVTISRDELYLILASLHTYCPIDLKKKVDRDLLQYKVENLLKAQSRLRHENRDQDS